MKRFVFFPLAAILFLAAIPGLSAQEAVTADLFAPTDSVKVKPYEVYCELIAISNGIFTNKVTVAIDFGQSASFWSNDRVLVDENGNSIVFNSLLDAANYLGRRGWTLRQTYITQSISKGDSNPPTKHWVLAKTVTSDAEITEGLFTKGMTKR